MLSVRVRLIYIPSATWNDVPTRCQGHKSGQKWQHRHTPESLSRPLKFLPAARGDLPLEMGRGRS